MNRDIKSQGTRMYQHLVRRMADIELDFIAIRMEQQVIHMSLENLDRRVGIHEKAIHDMNNDLMEFGELLREAGLL